jgi:hypothetical protein
VTAADVDGDGLLDLVAANRDGNYLTLFFQTAPGGFSADRSLTLGDRTVTSEPACVQAADLDADGDLDLVSANAGGNDLTIFYRVSPEAREPSAWRPVRVPVPGGKPAWVTTADLDGDGRLDLTSANVDGDNLSVFFRAGGGRFTAQPDETLGDSTTLSGPVSVVAADLDGDGDLDLAAANQAGNDLAIFLQTSPRTFTLGSPLGDAGSPLGPVSVRAGDLDGDGDLDLVSANQAGDNLTIFFQSDGGDFSPTASVILGDAQTTPSPAAVKAADLDGDGDLDLAVASLLEERLTLFFQAGPGEFAPAEFTPRGGAGPVDIAVGDLDGDGDLDLVAANRGERNLSTFLQTEPGTFVFSSDAALEHPPTRGLPNAVEAADLDGDGDLDLVAANSLFENNLTIFFQTSPGAFIHDPGGPLATADQTSDVAVADLDGDGDPDLVAANQLGDNLMLFFQTAPGGFPSRPDLTLGGPGSTRRPGEVAAVDLDGDGDVDLISANQAGDNLTIFYGGK